MQATETIPPQVLRMPDVCARTGLAKSWIYAAVRRGEFPSPFRLTAKAVAWDAAEVDEWLRDRMKRKAGREEATR